MRLGTGALKVSGEANCEKYGKEVTRQPWKWEPPLPAAANWQRHTERILSGKNTYPSEILTCTPTRQQGGKRGSKNPPRFASTKRKGDRQ